MSETKTAVDPLRLLAEVGRIAADLRTCRHPDDLPAADRLAALAILPELVATVRAVLDLADELDARGHVGLARRIRATVTAALGGTDA